MNKLDPIKDGRQIFKNIFSDFGTSITELDQLNTFLERVIIDTQGWVIVDFLDSANWDCLGSFSIDEENSILVLNWHRFTRTTNINDFISDRAPRGLF